VGLERLYDLAGIRTNEMDAEEQNCGLFPLEVSLSTQGRLSLRHLGQGLTDGVSREHAITITTKAHPKGAC
jgi:hypothetical protein